MLNQVKQASLNLKNKLAVLRANKSKPFPVIIKRLS